jgi:hypothetical protein
MTALPDPDSSAYRALVLEGRLQAMGAVLAACEAAYGNIDPDADAEDIALAYARAHSDFADWLVVSTDEAKSELRSIADELGMGDLPHDGDD